MFYAIIRDINDKPIIATSGELTASPAEYFTGCVATLANLLSGGADLNKKAQIKNQEPFKTHSMIMSAIPIFLGQLCKHPAFSTDIVLDTHNINFPIFQKIAAVLHASCNDTSSYMHFLNLVSQIKILGIKSIQFIDDFTNAQRKLYSCNFPDELIPEKYFCALTAQVMGEVCFDKRNPDIFFDKSKIIKQITEKSKNPYTNLPMQIIDLAYDEILQKNIDNFLAKVDFIFRLFQGECSAEYQRYKEQIQSELALKDLVKQIEIDIKKREYSKKQDEVTLSTLIDNSKKPNPIKLYQQAITEYKNKAYDKASILLEQALELFWQKADKAKSIEYFKCCSTLVSCYRELKNYDKAIDCAEQCILNVDSEVDITILVKKYHECLKLRGDKPEDLYQQAVNHFKRN